MKNKFITIETTYPNQKRAKNLAQILLDKKLAACIQFVKIESMYFWDKKIQNDSEILVRIKTKNSLFLEVKKIIQKHHSYENPQIISTQINQGSEQYFNWIDLSTKLSPKNSK